MCAGQRRQAHGVRGGGRQAPPVQPRRAVPNQHGGRAPPRRHAPAPLELLERVDGLADGRDEREGALVQLLDELAERGQHAATTYQRATASQEPEGAGARRAHASGADTGALRPALRCAALRCAALRCAALCCAARAVAHARARVPAARPSPRRVHLDHLEPLRAQRGVVGGRLVMLDGVPYVLLGSHRERGAGATHARTRSPH